MTATWRIAGAAGAWRVEAHELALPPPADDAVVVEVEATSLGAPDVAIAVPGRSAVGRVVAAGPGGRHLEGVRVLVGGSQPCGDCDLCRRGGAPVCPAGRTLGVDAPGGLATHVVARARWVLPLDGDLALPSPTAALLGHEGALAYALYARAGVGPREPTIVLGDGAVARLLVDVLIAKSAPPIVITGDAALAAWAEGRGATPVAPGDAAAVRGAAIARGHGDRPWRLFACDGAVAADAVALAGPRASVAAVAPIRGHLDVAAAMGREVTLIGVRGAHPDLLPELAALAVRGELDLAGACEVVSLAELPAALDRGPRAVVVTIPGS